MESESRPLVSLEEPTHSSGPATPELLRTLAAWCRSYGKGIAYLAPPALEKLADQLDARPPDSPDIRGLLNQLMQEARKDGATDFQDADDYFSDATFRARTALESAFSVLRKELKRTQFFSDDWRETAAKYATFADSLRSELARLQAEQLTPEEAGYMLDRIPPESDVEGGYYPIERPIIAKLRSRLRGQTND